MSAISSFKVGDLISRSKGYSFNGEIRSVFTTRKGDVKVVAELFTDSGLETLHIFNAEQMEPFYKPKPVYPLGLMKNMALETCY